jgi:predicted amidophosphoribosyltransferase
VQKERGFNLAQIFCSVFCASFGNILVQDALLKTKETKHQVGLSKSEREQNLTGAFEAVANTKLKEANVIIVFDDVATTGQTLKTAISDILNECI